MNRRIGIVVGLIAVISFAGFAKAQPLAERVPSDAIMYVGWAGANSMGPGYEGSHLKAMLDAAEVPRIVSEIIPQLMQKLAEEEPEAAGAANLAEPILGPMWKHPTALYVGPVVFNEGGGPPMPNVAILCDAGEDAESMKQQIDRLLEQAAGQTPFPITSRSSGTVVAIVVGNPPGLDAVFDGNAKAQSLASVKSFATPMAKQKSPVLAAYIDAQAILKIIDENVVREAPPDKQKEWQSVRDGLGLSGLQRLSLTQGFDGKDFSTRVFIEAPSPRKGLLAALDSEPISDDLLKSIPSTATVAGVGRADLAALFDAIQKAVRQLDPNASKEWDKGIADVNKALGLDFRKDVLGTFGDEWAYYIAPEITGRGPLGMVFMNRLRDANKARASFSTLKDKANEFLEKEADKDVKVQIKSAKFGSAEVDYVAMPFISPTWTIQNGNLYIGMYPQIVAGAIAQSPKQGKSLLDNPNFVALRKRLGAEKASSIQFYDLPSSAPSSYQIWLLVSSFGKLGDFAGVDTPPMLLPPLQKLMQHLSIAGAASWVDDTGWHFRSITPFPGSTFIASETAGSMDVQTTAIMMSILLPSLNNAREQANRIKSASNLRQIGLSAQMYANENKGSFPDELAATLGDLSVEVYLNPRTKTAKPEGLEGDALKTWINESSDYVWIGKGKNFNADATVILAHERPDGLNDGLNILFADGHVEWLTMPHALQSIEAGKIGPPVGEEPGAKPDGL